MRNSTQSSNGCVLSCSEATPQATWGGFDASLSQNSSPFHFCPVHALALLLFSMFWCFTSIISLLVWVMAPGQAK